ncbi:UNVERIFIED_CONTAM: hypothetical protein Slati_1335000 [Sesamum latifolium]|uniref:Reverse transcriptase domain-containing protein n=1 Tax=Sesamum latifolium TaxID=2727402 RepID=A0AAW2XKA6_9LAMI
MWKQRAKALCLKEGDRNTAFFHARASERKLQKKIKTIKNNEGQPMRGKMAVRQVVLDYFDNIFQSINPEDNVIREIVDVMRPRVTDEMNAMLIQPFTVEEVFLVLKQMHPLKSPGPDVYKFASKTIANRLRPLLNSLISPSQSAFVPGRLLTDNILVAYEINHFLSHKQYGSIGHVSLKLDISKAYDHVEWNFLRRVLVRIGFHSKFIDLIMLCVTTVSYSFLLNGEEFGLLQPGRCLRQGDPLSPYLFLFCAEAFSSFVSQAERNGELQGVAISRYAPRVSHLLFADNTLIFCQATSNAMACIKRLLESLERALGLKINLEKSAMVFSINVSSTARENLAAILGVTVEERHAKYLGLPTIIGRSKREVFDSVKDRIWSKMQGWAVKKLS